MAINKGLEPQQSAVRLPDEVGTVDRPTGATAGGSDAHAPTSQVSLVEAGSAGLAEQAGQRDHIKQSNQTGQSDDIGEAVEQAYLLPRSLDELRVKRSGFFKLDEGDSPFGSGWADYAHSLLTSWQAHEALLERETFSGSEKSEAGVKDSRLSRLFIDLKQRNAIVTTSFHPIFRERSEQPVLVAASDVIRLQGKQTFGAEALLADELLVWVREKGEAAPAVAALLPVSLPGLRLKGVGGTGGVPALVEITYDDAVIPSERLLIDGDADYASRVLAHPLARSLADYQRVSRQLWEAELLAGTAFALAEQTGWSTDLHIQGELGKLIQGIETLKALLHASELGAAASPSGALLPALLPLQAARKAGGDVYAEGVQVLQRIGADAFLNDPSASEPLAPGAKPTLLQLAWRLAGSAEAIQAALREQHAFGGTQARSLELYRHYPERRLRSRYEAFWAAIRLLEQDHFEEVRQ
ncbi:4-hydroxyphenylacetate 3-hydroxylase C-terminal domain-containing protein [Paenibacillus sp. NPDC058071]|uniref:4-hydroxyphenylacetate 3-hydroxylase C-terminal domain-containing protein n=1 Tax=Paenibacillus sp. NPDC058071 TaxID=3346326 RepID=UPI0036D9616E